MDIGKRIREKRKAAGLTQTQVADYFGIRGPSVSEWESKNGPSKEKLPALARLLKTSVSYLLTGKDGAPAAEIDLTNNPDYPAIRRVNLRLSAGMTGFSVDYEDDEGDMIVFKRRWYEMHNYKPDKLIAIRVQGESMESGLHQNDTVVVNTEDTTPKDGEVFAVNYEGEAVIKRLTRDRGEWWLSSDNPDQRRYPRKACAGDACILIGRVVHKQSERI